MAVSLADRQVVAQLFEGLVRLGPDLEPRTAAASGFERVGDRWRFYLRPGARFHDGRPVRSADAKASLERALSPELGAPRVDGLAAAIAGGREFHAGRTRGIGGISIVDSLTLDILPASPRAPLLDELASPAAYLVPDDIVETRFPNPSFGRTPVGSGPFRFARFDSSGVEFVAAPGRFGGPDTLEFRPERSSERAILDFELGRIDLVASNGREIQSPPKGAVDRPDVLEIDEASTHYLGFDTRKPFLADRMHRRALAGAIDRALAVKVLVPGRGRLALGLVPPAMGGSPVADSWLPPLSQSQKLARAFAARAPELSLWLPAASPSGLRIAEYVASAYRRLGYRIRIVERPWAEFERGVLAGQADLFYMPWFANGSDAGEFMSSLVDGRRRGAGGNQTFYSNPRVDAALDAARRAADPVQSASALQTAERIALEDAPLLPLFHGVNVTLVRPGVRGIQLHPLGTPRYDAVEVGDAR
jgi:peptide/nickel transport system substrate-binding protein/oligopeptide transport system substrate-binding protein